MTRFLSTRLARGAALATTALAATLATAATSSAQSRPTVVVTLENPQPSRGTLLTPVWVGLHDGTFDLYNRGEPASSPLGGNEIEALAEDGNNAPLAETFAREQPGAPQVPGLAGAFGPLAPGDTASVALEVDPFAQRYLSYGSMILPSNDFFIANGNPEAVELFDGGGTFVGRDFVVTGDRALDAGTEVNDEIASNVAFLGQSAPDTGQPENGVVSPAEGFAAPGTLTYPDGVLNHPIVGNGTFNTPRDGLLKVSLQFVDLAANLRLSANLSAHNEVPPVVSDATGTAQALLTRGQTLSLFAFARDLTGPVTVAHLHFAPKGANGPVVVDLTSRVRGTNLFANISASDLTDAFPGSFDDFVKELVAGNIYLNIHTGANPAGEIRGQLRLN